MGIVTRRQGRFGKRRRPLPRERMTGARKKAPQGSRKPESGAVRGEKAAWSGARHTPQKGGKNLRRNGCAASAPLRREKFSESVNYYFLSQGG